MLAEQGYNIKLQEFDGPFDLLLFFIERDELNIHDIPIAKITNEFLAYIQLQHSLNIELASEFILVAATLMRIKVKMLIPRPEIDDAGNEVDPRQDLVARLLEYKQYKDAAQELEFLHTQRSMMLSRGNTLADNKLIAAQLTGAEELLNFDLYKLLTIYTKVLDRYRAQNTVNTHTVVAQLYSIEEQKEALTRLLEINEKLDFNEILKNSKDRVQLIYNVLAVLEMLQQQLISIEIGLGFNNFKISNYTELAE